MRTQSMDTHPDIERVQIELIRKASPAKLFGIVNSLSATMMQASRANLRRLHPDLSEEEFKYLVIETYYGKELADRVRVYDEKRKNKEQPCEHNQ